MNNNEMDPATTDAAPAVDGLTGGAPLEGADAVDPAGSAGVSSGRAVGLRAAALSGLLVFGVAAVSWNSLTHTVSQG